MKTGNPLRLVVCSTGIPHEHFHPKLSASLMLLWRYLQELSKDAEIFHVILLDRKNDDSELLKLYKENLADPLGIQFSVWHSLSLLQSRASLLLPPHARPLPQEFTNEMREFRPDAIFCLDAYSPAAFTDFSIAPIFVQVHDPKFQTLWYHALYLFRENPLKIKQVLTDLWQSYLWKGYYKRALQPCTRVVTVALSSIPPLKRMGIDASLFPMLWLDPTEGCDLTPVSLSVVPTFLFQGNLAGLGSRASLHFLLHDAYPHIRKIFGEGKFKILLCGARSLPEWAQKEIDNLSEVEFLGFVDDIVATMRSCHAVLAPIDVPIGNRTRILTAMAAKVLVIAHKSIASANPHLINGETCLIATDGKSFAEHMHAVVAHPEIVSGITKRARERYDKEFHPTAASKALLDALRAMIS